jgi:hypothetical protein
MNEIFYGLPVDTHFYSRNGIQITPMLSLAPEILQNQILFIA